MTYYKSDFKNITGLGNNKHAECPVCGSTDNVSINIEKGLVHCFTPGCTCNGTYIDKDRPAEGEPTAARNTTHKHHEMKNNDTEGLTAHTSLIASTYPKSAADVPVYPTDFKGVDEHLLHNLYDLTETEAEKGLCATLVRNYLESIHISLDTAQHFGLKAYPFNYEDKATGQKTTEGRSLHHSLCYPTFLFGRCVNLKSRAVDVKAFRNEKANKQLPGVPYNIDHFADEAHRTDTLIFTEGERDVLSLYESGLPGGVSVANGGGEDVRKILTPFAEWVNAVEDIVICGDNDFAGRLLKMRLLFLFRDRARMAVLPTDCKDISDVLVAYGPERVRQIIAEAKLITPHNLVRPVSITEQLKANLRGEFDKGYTCGYGKDFDLHLMFTLRGGLMVTTGYPGAGKSDFLYDLAAHLIAHQQKRVTFVSLEQPDNADAMAGVLRRLAGVKDMSVFSDSQIDFLIDHLDQHMNCFDVESGDPSVADIIDACTRNLKLFHPDFLVVDNYARLRRDNVDDQNETEFIRNLLVALQNWGLRNHVWVIVVAHPRKPQDAASAETADAATVAGSAHWNNLADLGMTVKRVIREDGTDYKEIIIWKVRDQRICTPGTIFLLRQPCGRYEVRSSRQEIETECLTGIKYRDREMWLSEELTPN